MAGHAFVENVRRSRYDFAIGAAAKHRLAGPSASSLLRSDPGSGRRGETVLLGSVPADPTEPDNLIGRETGNALPEQPIAAFEDHRTLGRTVEAGLDEAHDVFDRLERLGVDRVTSGRCSRTRASLVEEVLLPVLDAPPE